MLSFISCADDTTIYVEKLMQFYHINKQKQPELVSEFSKVAEYKLNTENCLYLHILSEIEIYKPCQRIASQNMTCLGVNLTKSKQDLHPKNYKPLMREIKENPNRERSYIYGSGDTTLLRCPFFPNRPIYPMQLDIKIKIPGGFFFFFWCKPTNGF